MSTTAPPLDEDSGSIVQVVFCGEPVAKGRPRLTKRGIAYTPARTRNFERALGFQAFSALRGRVPITGPVRLSVEIALPMPKSWPAQKRIDALVGRVLPTSRPDTDNYLKHTSDAIGGIVIADDAQVVALVAQKVYGDRPQIRIVVEPLEFEVVVMSADDDNVMPFPGTNGADDGGEADEILAYSLRETIAWLTTLPKLDYERQRTLQAHRHGIRVSVLDELVAEAKGIATGSGKKAGTEIEIETVEPIGGEAAPGYLILDMVERELARHAIMGEHDRVAVILWSAHTHAIDATDIAPILCLTSPTRSCGKTTVVEFVQHLVPRPLRADDLSAPVIFRAVEKFKPVVLMIDEFDGITKGDQTKADSIKHLLNSGYKRGGQALRLVGDGFELRGFATFAAKMIALIGQLPSSWAPTASRCITVGMRRKPKTATVEKLRGNDAINGVKVLARHLARWTGDNIVALHTAQPAIPPGLNDRQTDCWTPLLAIADRVGGDWPARAREAAVALSSVRPEEAYGEMMLSDLRDYFDANGDTVFSERLVTWLKGLEDRAWAQWRNGKGIDKTDVAKMLRPFDARTESNRKSTTVKIDGETAKGYRREWFAAAFETYLDTPPFSPSPTSPSQKSAVSEPPSPSPDDLEVTGSTGLNPAENRQGDVGDGKIPPTGTKKAVEPGDVPEETSDAVAPPAPRWERRI